MHFWNLGVNQVLRRSYIHAHTHKIRIQLCYFLFPRLAVVLFVKQHECQHIHMYFHLCFFLPPPCQICTINSSTDTHTYALFVNMEKGFLCKWLETMTNVYNRHGSFILSFIQTNVIITNKGKSVAVHLDSVYLCVCAQPCFPDQLCFLPCAVHWAMSKSINMWKKYTSLWSTVHCVLVRSGVGVGGCGLKRK